VRTTSCRSEEGGNTFRVFQPTGTAKPNGLNDLSGSSDVPG
jgi:hypothetical protein